MIPDELSDEQVVLLADIASTGISGAESGRVRIGDSVVVFAQGPIGLCATAGAKLMGAALVIGVDGNPTSNAKPGFGVLVVDPAERVQGVLLYEGNPIPGAPRLGEVSLGSSSIPLIGVQADPSTFTDPSCPSLFPDSVLQ